MGYSLGTLHSLHIGNFMPDSFRGMVLMAPFTNIPEKYRMYMPLLPALNALASYLPRWNVVAGFDRRPTIYEYLHKDPIKTQCMTARNLTYVVQLMQELPEPEKLKSPPILALFGARDGTTGPHYARSYLSKTP